MRVVVPFAAGEPKTRLAPLFSPEQRMAFSHAMLRTVVDAVRAADGDPEILATGPVEIDAPVTIDERALTPAVNAVLAETDEPTAVVTADLALATPEAVGRLLTADGEVVIVPGRGGGTNALVVRHPAFRVDYHGASYLDHRHAAREIGATVSVIDSYRLSTDVDEPADLAEVLLHGEGPACEWLRDAGFELAVEEGRVGVERS